MEKVIYSKYSNQRNPQFAIRTDIIKFTDDKKAVRKYPLTAKAKNHADNIMNIYGKLENIFSGSLFVPNKAEMKQNYIEFEFLEGRTLEEVLDECILNSDYDSFYLWIKKYVDEIKKTYEENNFEKTQKFIDVFGDVKLPAGEKGVNYIDIDLVFSNIIVHDNAWTVIDYEWTFDFCVPVNYVIWRALREYVLTSSVRDVIPIEKLIDFVGINETAIRAYESMEIHFQYDYCYKEQKNLHELYNIIGERVVGSARFSDMINKEDDLYKVQLYYGYDGELTEENSEFIKIIPDEKGICHLTIGLSENIHVLRMDPAQKRCVLEIYKAFGYVGEQEYELKYAVNGYEFSDKSYVIDNDDPQILFDEIVEGTEKIEIFYMINSLSDNKDIISPSRELQNAISLLNEKNNEIASEMEKLRIARGRIREQERILENTQKQLQESINTVNAMKTSRSWRLTAPVRKMSDILRKSRGLRFIWRVVKSFKNEGIKASFKKIPAFIKRHAKNTHSSDHICRDNNKKIAVHLHLYYEDLLEEFCEYFNNITEPFDLYISCRQGVEKKPIYKYAKKIRYVKKIVIRETPNRGRDIAPFYVLFGEELKQYDCLLHVHSKKSLYTGKEKQEWRHWAVDGVLKNEESVRETLRLLLEKDDVGLVYGEMTPQLSLFAMHWLRNIPRGAQLLSRLNADFENEMLFYPVGSFFWVKTDAVRPLFDIKLSYEDFDEEAGQIDGTLAHALERVIAALVEQRGYHTYIFDQENESFSKDISYKSFEQYFGYNVDNNTEFLSNYDVITFDVFDTLITRMVYKPDDLFLLMERIIFDKYGISLKYLQVRKEAERRANVEKGDFCNIDDIYEKMSEITDLSEEQIKEIKKLEIDLEYKLCYPRKDALKVFNNLKGQGKRIILISDMYLTREIIDKMLKKCGYEGYEDIWISCEMGLRKDKDSMWVKFAEEFGEYNTIHVGDNPQSDIQAVVDMGRANRLWLSPRSQFRFSKQYDGLKKYIDTTVENSLMLGYFINVVMYNSPFALKSSGTVKLDMAQEAAKALFAPMFMAFADFMTKMESNKLLFLSREGHFLQQLYKKYVETFHIREKDNCYFYTSRRASAVAQIRNEEDIREVLSTDYEGMLSNVLWERLGLEINEEKDVDIKLPEKIDYAVEILKQYEEQLSTKIKSERKIYEEYLLRETCGYSLNDVCVVDVGYSGTIQYYLMKLCGEKINGCYLATVNTKPPRIGGICNRLYDFMETNVFFYAQLFLESVTAAPHGQLIRMKKQDDKILPIFKDDIPANIDETIKMQKSILDYIGLMGECFNNMIFEVDKNLCVEIFGETLRPGIFTQEIADFFSVNDNYCMGNGEWVYDSESCGWELRNSKL